VERVDENSGRTYYWNEETNETSWECPLVPPQVLDKVREVQLTETTGIKDEDQRDAVVESNNVLPRDWIEVVDEDTGKLYYYNTVTEETSWTPPEENHKGSVIRGEDDDHQPVCPAFLQSVEDVRSQFGINGPLALCKDSDVISFFEHKADSSDLLWQLVAIAARSKGRLRSDEGLSDESSPEAAIIELLLQDDKSADTTPTKSNEHDSRRYTAEGMPEELYAIS
jgi:WW domain